MSDGRKPFGQTTRLCPNTLLYFPHSYPVIHRIRLAHVPGSIPLYRSSAIYSGQVFSLSIFFLPALALPALAGWFYQTQRWAVAPDSVTLKCIPRKILPFCERVIFREKRRKGLVRQPCTASVNPKRFRQKRTEQRETKNKFR
ncbi:MAG: hypothetical protein ACLTFL_18100 [Bacteroides thetaiotaomicron]